MGRKRKNGVLIDFVVERIIKEEYVSTPFIQRAFQIGYVSARKVIKQLHEMGYIENENEFKNIRVIKHKYIQ